jgi:hypothetical protein
MKRRPLSHIIQDLIFAAILGATFGVVFGLYF